MAAQLRGACASGLAEIRDAHALIDITPLLFDRGANVPINPELRSVAAKAIGRLGNPDGLAVLSILLRFPNLEDDLEVLSSCMAAAMELNPEEALPLVSGYIETEYRGLVAPAAIAIINSGVAGGEVHIGRALSVSRGDKLMAICLTLAAKRSVQGVEILYGLGSSERDDHRGAFADAVGETLDRNAAPILKVLAVSDRSLTVRAAAAKALKAIGKARDHI
jgi:HEAT repeat protein